jgi:hypothetical protein
MRLWTLAAMDGVALDAYGLGMNLEAIKRLRRNEKEIHNSRMENGSNFIDMRVRLR